MTSDEIVYASLLLLSIPCGLLIRSISDHKIREVVAAIAGATLILLTCGKHSWHSVLTIAVNTSIICVARKNRYVHVLSFLWCFSYLAFFRTSEWFGVEKPSPPSNAVQLLLTLRLVGVAGEVVDTEELQGLSPDTHKEADRLRLKYKGIDSSWYCLLSYSFCYIGSLTGPFYTCRTFQDMVHNSSIKKLPLWSDLKLRLTPLPVCAALFLVLSLTISVQRAREDDFYEGTHFLYRYGYLYLLFLWFRTRFYSAWILAECMAVTAGLGAYPSLAVNRSGAGPTNLQALEAKETEEPSETEYDFETIRNILPIEIERSSSLGGTIRHWNMAVQWWLVVHVYKNIPIHNKLIRSCILMTISAFWHGVHPGWYATFLSAPFLLLAEDGMNRGVRDRLVSERQRNIYDTLACFISMRFFEYFGVGALFLVHSEIYRFWASLHFYGHILLFIFIVVGQTLALLPRSLTKKMHQS